MGHSRVGDGQDLHASGSGTSWISNGGGQFLEDESLFGEFLPDLRYPRVEWSRWLLNHHT